MYKLNPKKIDKATKALAKMRKGEETLLPETGAKVFYNFDSKLKGFWGHGYSSRLINGVPADIAVYMEE